MTSFITTTCPTCGEIDVAIEEVLLRVNEETSRGACVVCCPHCGARFTKEADDSMMILLVSAGITVQSWRRPAEVDERPSGLSPITHAELVRFAEVLDDATLTAEWLQPHE